MNDPSTSRNLISGTVLHLTKLYMALAFIGWKASCLYLGGAARFYAPWSVAVEAGYWIGVGVLAVHAWKQLRAGKQDGVVSDLFFAALGILFLVQRNNISLPTVVTGGDLLRWGLNGLMLYVCGMGWRRFRSRALAYWFWGYAIRLTNQVFSEYLNHGAGLHAAMGQQYQLRWLWEFHLLWIFISNLFLLAGLILFFRQGATSAAKPMNMASRVAVWVLLAIVSIYPSEAFFGSPEFAAGIVIQAMIFGFCLAGCWRQAGGAFGLWAWGSGIALLFRLTGQIHYPASGYPNDLGQLIETFRVVGGLYVMSLWLSGLLMLLRQMAAEPGVTGPTAGAAAEPVSPLILFPFLPGWLKHRAVIVGGLGLLLIAAIWFHGKDPRDVFTLAPKYEGHTLAYWSEHGNQKTWNGAANPDLDAAIQSLGPKAVPELVDWIGRPQMLGGGMDPHGEQALRGFTLLGPVAAPAVPKLIKMIAYRSGFPQRALVCIGQPAVPALADKLVTTFPLTTNEPTRIDWRDPHYETSPYQIQSAVIVTLGQMGTNAAAAVPALIRAVQSGSPWTQAQAAPALADIGANVPDQVIPVLMAELTRTGNTEVNRGAMADALGVIGGQRPNAVIPVLITQLTNASTTALDREAIANALAALGQNRSQLIVPVLIRALAQDDIPTGGSRPIFQRGYYYSGRAVHGNGSIFATRSAIADALAVFGSEARAAVPLLVAAGQSTNAELRIHAALAVQKIAPETPGVLDPLAKNLADKDQYDRQMTLMAMENLGTNGMALRPAVVALVRYSGLINDQIDGMRCLASMGSMGQPDDEVIAVLADKSRAQDQQVSEQAVQVLNELGARSKGAFLALAEAMREASVTLARQEARNALQGILYRDTSMLAACLGDADPHQRYLGLQVVDQLGRWIEEPPQTANAAQQALHDSDPAARLLGTNVLMRLDTERYGPEVAEALVHGGNLEATDAQGETILHRVIMAPSEHRLAAANALLDAGENPNAKDKLGRTPAHLLLTTAWPWEGVPDLYFLLARRGADFSARDNEGRTPLHYLAGLGHERPLFFIHGIAGVFESAKVDFQVRDNEGETPLHIAVRTQTADVYDWLLKNGASLDVTDKAGQTARQMGLQADDLSTLRFKPEVDIGQAIRSGQLEDVEAIAKTDPSLVNRISREGEEPLIEAIQCGQTNIIAFLDQQGAVWQPDWALMAGRNDVLQKLLVGDPAVATRSYSGSTLLQQATSRNDTAAVNLLLAAGADVNVVDSYGLSILGVAQINHQDDIARLLLARGARRSLFDAVANDDASGLVAMIGHDHSRIFSTNAIGNTLAEIAAASGSVRVLDWLLDQGVPPAARNVCTGESLLHVAAAYDQTNIAALLIRRGVPLNEANNAGMTPMHVAALMDSTEVLGMLLDHRLDCDARMQVPAAVQALSRHQRSGSGMFGAAYSNLDGSTPLHVAALYGQVRNIKLLLARGASINATNASGNTPLDLAERGGMMHVTLRERLLLTDRLIPPVNVFEDKSWTPRDAAKVLGQAGAKLSMMVARQFDGGWGGSLTATTATTVMR